MTRLRFNKNKLKFYYKICLFYDFDKEDDFIEITTGFGLYTESGKPPEIYRLFFDKDYDSWRENLKIKLDK